NLVRRFLTRARVWRRLTARRPCGPRPRPRPPLLPARLMPLPRRRPPPPPSLLPPPRRPSPPSKRDILGAFSEGIDHTGIGQAGGYGVDGRPCFFDQELRHCLGNSRKRNGGTDRLFPTGCQGDLKKSILEVLLLDSNA